ncbi:Reticulon-4 [Nymphon striatum]|nr:Reticulon-4 [Nymphon striatum]
MADSTSSSMEGMPEAQVKEGQSSEKSCSACVFINPCIWFDKEKLNPKVADLLYWKDVKKTGVAFGSILLVLLSLAYFSLISVIAYSSLALLGVAMSFRIYKSVITAVQKSNEGHPFKECLDKEYSLSPEKVRQISDFVLDHAVSIMKKTKSLFLVEDFVDSIKFGLVLWGLTYIGAWFNGMTLLILAFVSAFTLPKVYETHQTQIDHYLGIAMAQIKDVTDKVKAKVPMLNKKKEE